MNKYLLRSIYNKIASRRLKVWAIKALSSFNFPVYRIGLDTNNSCNLKCLMCGLSLPGPKQKREIMPLPLFENIARQAFRKTRVLDLSCAYEPFMTKNILDYLRIARRHTKADIGVCTNALLLDEDRLNAILTEGLLDEINISCDGLSEKTYNSIRQNGSFAKLLEVLALIDERKRRRGTPKPTIRMNYTMLQRNIEELEGVYAFAKQYHIDIMQLRHVKLTRSFEALFDESLYYHQALSDRVLEKVISDYRQDPRRQLIHPPLFKDGAAAVTSKASCAYPWFNFIISSDGKINMCNIGPIGNFNEQTFQEMLRSEKVKAIHRKLLKGSAEQLCENCHFVSDMESVKNKATFIREDLETGD